MHDPKPIAKDICFDLDLSVVVLVKAEELIENAAKQNLLSGKSPTGIAAGAVYAATLLTASKVTQADVADVVGTRP